nr:reverse transcriptase domain-containing protein [Tanacetum cinerariifolium]
NPTCKKQLIRPTPATPVVRPPPSLWQPKRTRKDFWTRHILLRCDSSGDLYPVTKPSTIPTALLSTSSSTWHQRLGYPDDEVLRLVHRPISYQPQQQLTPITSPWPFYKWGIDIAGPFPVATGGLKFLIVAIDYFTKWIEAKAVATITEAVIPAEIGMPTIRTAEVNVATNDDERRIDLDLLEERHERAAICEAKTKSKIKGYYDAKEVPKMVVPDLQTFPKDH